VKEQKELDVTDALLLTAGLFASGKSTGAQRIAKNVRASGETAVILSRDVEGGAVKDLLPKMKAAWEERVT
jgi:hypothetical protein